MAFYNLPEDNIKRPYHIQAVLKGGAVVEFDCSECNMTHPSICIDGVWQDDTQRIQTFTWENAMPAVMYLHLDNIASVLCSYYEE